MTAYRKGLAKAFKAAKPFLADRQFICWALDSAYTRGRITVDAYCDARDLIRRRLGRSNQVEGWLYLNVPEFRTIPEGRRARLVRQYRRRWLDSLIKEFSE